MYTRVHYAPETNRYSIDKYRSLLIKLSTPVDTNKFCKEERKLFLMLFCFNICYAAYQKILIHDSFYLVVTSVQKPQQWQTQSVIKSMRRQRKLFTCVKSQWPWLKVGLRDKYQLNKLSQTNTKIELRWIFFFIFSF